MQFDLEQVVTIDFETYFDAEYSLRSKDMNSSEYVRSPLFLAHCVAIKEGTQATRVVWYDDIRPAIEQLKLGPRCILGHNIAFDGLILAEHYDLVPQGLYLDTMSMGRALHGNSSRASLEALCAVYGIPGKNPNILSKMKGHREIPAALREEATIYCAGDVDKCFDIFSQMIEIYPKDEVKLIDWTVRQFCDPVLYIDQPRAAAALEREILKKKELIEKTGLDEEQLQSAAKFAEQLRALGVEPPMKESARTKLQTYAFSQQDDEFMALVVHENPKVRELMAARLAAKSTIGESRARRFVNVGERPLPVGLNYFAAHTGRWGGTNKTNLQNLEKEEHDTDGKLIPFTGELRKCIIAPPGYVICVADSAQIEARTNGWLSGQADLLELFRASGDPYCALASDIYGRTITKADRDPRAVGKAGVLGLGFYMGAVRFQATLALGLLGPKIDMPIEQCWEVVKAYRKKNNKIVALWDDLEVVIANMYRKSTLPGGGMVYAYKPGVVEYDGQSVWLPSGMGLHYPDLHCAEDSVGRPQFSYRANKEYVKLHAGILTENIIQGLARVIIGEQLLRINERYRVVMMTHDEIVCVAPVTEADACLEFMLKEMATSPSWAPDLPLKAEGGWAPNYSK